MIRLPEYGGSGELPPQAYGLTEAEAERGNGDEPDEVAEAMDAPMEAEIVAAWAEHERGAKHQ